MCHYLYEVTVVTCEALISQRHLLYDKSKPQCPGKSRAARKSWCPRPFIFSQTIKSMSSSVTSTSLQHRHFLILLLNFSFGEEDVIQEFSSKAKQVSRKNISWKHYSGAERRGRELGKKPCIVHARIIHNKDKRICFKNTPHWQINFFSTDIKP